MKWSIKLIISNFTKLAFILGIPAVSLIILLALNSDVQAELVAAQNANPKPGATLPQLLLPAEITGVTVPRQAPNLLPDPSFEEATELPNPLWRRGGDCATPLDSTTPAHEGANSAWLIGNDNDCHLRSKLDTIPIEAGKYYDISCWIKRDFINGDAFAELRFLNQNEALVGSPIAARDVVNTENGWDEVTASKLAPPTAQYAQVRLKVAAGSSGSARFDDCYVGLGIHLEIDKEHDPPEVTPGDFLTYTLAYTNLGREPASGVLIIETYPNEVAFQNANPEPDFSNNIWDTGLIPTNTTDVITISVQVGGDATGPFLLNQVEMLADDSEDVLEALLITPIMLPPVPTDTCTIITLPVGRIDKSGQPGEEVDYNYLVVNTGNQPGTVMVGHSETPFFSKKTAPMAPFSLLTQTLQPITLSITIPPTATQAISGTTISTTITTTLECAPSMTSTSFATATTRVERKAGVAINKGVQTKLPQNPISFTHWLTNTGNWSDTFQLSTVTTNTTASPLTVTIQPAMTISIGPGATRPVTITIEGVPTDRLEDPLVKAVITFTAQSISDTTVVDEATNVVGSACRANIGPKSLSNIGPPDATLTYHFAVTNTGLLTGALDLAHDTHPEWGGVVTPDSPVILSPGQSQLLTVSLIIPGGTISNTQELSSITATLQCQGEVISDTAVAMADVSRDWGVAIQPAQPQQNPSIFGHNLVNTGNWTDTINLITETRPVALNITIEPASTIQNLGPGATTLITVTAPGVFTDLANGPEIRAIITTTARSNSNAGVMSQVVDIVKTPIIYLPVINRCLTSISDEEPNNNVNIAQDLFCWHYTITGNVNRTNDKDDVYKIQASAGQTLTLTLTGSDDADLFLYPPGTPDFGTLPPPPFETASRNANTSNEFIQYKLTATGEWYIRVFAFNGNINYNLGVLLSNP